MTLEEQYKKKTGKEPIIYSGDPDGDYAPEFVEWIKSIVVYQQRRIKASDEVIRLDIENNHNPDVDLEFYRAYQIYQSIVEEG